MENNKIMQIPELLGEIETLESKTDKDIMLQIATDLSGMVYSADDRVYFSFNNLNEAFKKLEKEKEKW